MFFANARRQRMIHRINFRRIANAKSATCRGAKIFSRVVQFSLAGLFGFRISTFCARRRRQTLPQTFAESQSPRFANGSVV